MDSWVVPEERYRFNEPHTLGFDCTVEATRAQIVAFMRERENRWGFTPRLCRPMTDQECIDEFCAVHGAWKLEIGDLESCKERIKFLEKERSHYHDECMSKAISLKMEKDYRVGLSSENHHLRASILTLQKRMRKAIDRVCGDPAAPVDLRGEICNILDGSI